MSHLRSKAAIMAVSLGTAAPWAVSSLAAPASPAAPGRPPQPGRRLPKALGVDEVRRLLEAAGADDPPARPRAPRGGGGAPSQLRPSGELHHEETPLGGRIVPACTRNHPQHPQPDGTLQHLRPRGARTELTAGYETVHHCLCDS